MVKEGTLSELSPQHVDCGRKCQAVPAELTSLLSAAPEQLHHPLGLVGDGGT